MSQENVDIVKNAYRGLGERGVDGFLEFVHEDVEYLPVEESGAVRRHNGMRRYFERWLDSWGRLSGSQVWHFRDGRGARIEEYVDRAEALEAVGLSE